MVVLAFALIGCGARGAVVNGAAMGGEVAVFVASGPPAEARTAALAARSRVEAIEAAVTDWVPGAPVVRLNAGETVAPSPELVALGDATQRVHGATHGAFDPTVRPLLAVWPRDGSWPADAAVDEARARVGWSHVHRDGEGWRVEPGTEVGFGGIAQGYAAHEARAELGPHRGVVDVSGDLCVRGTFWVHVVAPRGDGFAARVRLRDTCLSTSGDYADAAFSEGRRVHHVIDPRTGRPSSGAIAATVVDEEGAVADALATALLVLGPDGSAVDALGAWALVWPESGPPTELGRRPKGLRVRLQEARP